MIPGLTPRGGGETETRKVECNQIAKQTDGTLHLKRGAGGPYPSGTSKKGERKLFKCPRASVAFTVKKQNPHYSIYYIVTCQACSPKRRKKAK